MSDSAKVGSGVKALHRWALHEDRSSREKILFEKVLRL
jgi:hypothetical protein